MVTTTSVTHASPAAAYASSPWRWWEDDAAVPPAAASCKDIARQLVENSPGRHLRVVLGGGRRHFLPDHLPDPANKTRKGARKDGRHLIHVQRTTQFMAKVTNRLPRHNLRTG